MVPSRSRRPQPLALWCALANQMIVHNFVEMAAFTLICVSAYLRPCEAVGLRRRCLVAPAPGVSQTWSLLVCPDEYLVATKTGDADDSIAMDSTWLQWLAPILSILAEGGKGKCVWNFGYPAYVREFRSALARLRVTGVVPYMMRHSGPSIDRSRGWRSQDEVQKRGRWKPHRSLTRCEKHATWGHTMLGYTAVQQAHFIGCEAHIADTVLGMKHPVVAHIRG